MSKKYRTIVADPPWPFTWQGGPGGRRRNPTRLNYPLMTLEQIAALPVGDVASDSAALFLWVTPRWHREGWGVKVAESWGFEVSGELVWKKPNFGMGAFPRRGHETCLVCSRGSGALGAFPRSIHSVQEWAQDYSHNGGKQHSAKPDAFYDLIEQFGAQPLLEMFARRARFGWDYWGNESLETTELPDVA